MCGVQYVLTYSYLSIVASTFRFFATCIFSSLFFIDLYSRLTMTSYGNERKDVDDLSRKELQQILKEWKLPASGSNAALRTRYSLAKESRSSALRPESSGFSTPTKQPPSAAKCSCPGLTTPPSSNSAFYTPPNNRSAIPAYSAPSSFQMARKKPSPQKEKRLKRFRNTCSTSTQQRIDRAKSQCMYLVRCGTIQDDFQCDFVVLGSTGNVYDVKVGPIPNCTCPDHQKGNLCKHILFVLLKVMALDAHSHLIYQAAWTSTELQSMFAQMKARFANVSGAVIANQQVQETFSKLSQGIDVEDTTKSGVARKAVTDDDCGICLEAMVAKSESLTYCRANCGANFHKTCLDLWLVQEQRNPTCPFCRGVWQDETAAAPCKKFSSEGFTNLGKLQGQSPVRDTSTYSEYHSSGWFQSPRRKRGRR